MYLAHSYINGHTEAQSGAERCFIGVGGPQNVYFIASGELFIVCPTKIEVGTTVVFAPFASTTDFPHSNSAHCNTV